MWQLSRIQLNVRGINLRVETRAREASEAANTTQLAGYN